MELQQFIEFTAIVSFIVGVLAICTLVYIGKRIFKNTKI